MATVARREAVLAALRTHYQAGVVPDRLGPSSAIVQRHAEGGYWISVFDDPEDGLAFLEECELGSFEPVYAVDLDSGRLFKVRDFSLGAELDSPFRAVAASLPVPAVGPLGPRSRLSGMALERKLEKTVLGAR